MCLAVSGTWNTEFLRGGDCPCQAATEHRKGQHEQQSLREHAAFSLGWDEGGEIPGERSESRRTPAGVCSKATHGVKKLDEFYRVKDKT